MGESALDHERAKPARLRLLMKRSEETAVEGAIIPGSHGPRSGTTLGRSQGWAGQTLFCACGEFSMPLKSNKSPYHYSCPTSEQGEVKSRFELSL